MLDLPSVIVGFIIAVILAEYQLWRFARSETRRNKNAVISSIDSWLNRYIMDWGRGYNNLRKLERINRYGEIIKTIIDTPGRIEEDIESEIYQIGLEMIYIGGFRPESWKTGLKDELEVTGNLLVEQSREIISVLESTKQLSIWKRWFR